jgi:hypothetical protein
VQLAPQNDQLMSERGIFGLKRIFDLNGEVKAANTKHKSQIVPPI